ncbi:MAG TPA: hypothetical protein VOA41_06570 [Candidatus Dormibacteraeota bacterium]|nr:hypothetical protein [Candidatus Dormibacteraeota bacterium]
MIAVVANPSERPLISEFFELFKTPWEFYRQGRSYEVVLSAGDSQFDLNAAKLVLTYAGRVLSSDCQEDLRVAPRGQHARIVSYRGTRIPIYGDCVTFPEKTAEVLGDEQTRQPAAYLDTVGGRMRARIGYDLFSEVRTLLTTGQPPEHAGIPTLELHIALLRDLIIASGAALAEIPPVPDGYPFIACLTHDVDHPSIRQHKFDRTMFGFLYRAIFGSLLNVFRGRASVSDLLNNWIAALKLPLVYAGLANDFWHRFEDYPKMEKGWPSTFFVIPFQGRPGQSARGPAPGRRAAGYGAADIAAQIGTLTAAGCEIGLHGIDAWRDSSCGREELQEIRRITGAREVGVRMHWLYFDEQSPLNLESAGATYDSTVGYNEAVGYRAGTTQAYKPLQATRLLELPLHVMDTALFYPDRLNLSPREARKQVDTIIGQVGQFGGSITVNWHDRSISPERQWGRFYEDLVDQLNSKGAWFSTAAQAVAWFQKRRSAVFETISWEADTLHLKIVIPESETVPGLRLRIHKPRNSGRVAATGAAACEADINISFNCSMDARIPLGSPKEMILPRETIANV